MASQRSDVLVINLKDRDCSWRHSKPGQLCAAQRQCLWLQSKRKGYINILQPGTSLHMMQRSRCGSCNAACMEKNVSKQHTPLPSSTRSLRCVFTHAVCVVYVCVYMLKEIQVVPGELELDEGASASMACSMSVPS